MSEYAPVATRNDESDQRIPYIGELFQSVPNLADSIMAVLFGGEPSTVWEVTRLRWFDEEIDPDTGELLFEELIISFTDVVDPTNTLRLNFLDLDIEVEKFVF